ncbi:MAG: 2-oxo acid dehydrogenase subunit E2 [Actinomycetota bacterium]
MRTSGWRRIATGVWAWPRDPQIYGRLDVDAIPILDAIDRVSATAGVKVSATDFIVRAVAHALAENPDVNTRLRFGRFVPRGGVDVFVIVSTGAGRDLSGVKVSHADRKDVVAVAREVDEEAGGVRDGRRTDLERAKRLLESLPLPLSSRRRGRMRDGAHRGGSAGGADR